jgi:putative acetyltransferase
VGVDAFDVSHCVPPSLSRLSDLERIFAIYIDAAVIPFLEFDPVPIEAFQPVFRELVESRCFFAYDVSGELAGVY